MADETLGEKTEPATPRRRQEAKERGQVARSMDLSSALILLGAMITLWLQGDRIFNELGGLMVVILDNMDGDLNHRTAAALAVTGILFLLRLMLPFMLAVAAISLAGNLMQTGFILTGKPLQPDLNRLNPITGIKRVFSLRGLMRLTASILKVAIVGAVLWWAVKDEMPVLIALHDMSVGQITAYAFKLSFIMGLRASLALLVLALLDYSYQRWQHEQDIRMSKQEIKDELKRMEGDPEVRRRRRAVQQRLAMQRMMQQVPEADVVITNPTELAIALAYREGEPAPEVLAKGAGPVAARIREIAAEHGVPIVEKKPLVRALYRAVEPGDFVPPQFYEAVAEILAFVYRMNERFEQAPAA